MEGGEKSVLRLNATAAAGCWLLVSMGVKDQKDERGLGKKKDQTLLTHGQSTAVFVSR